MAIQDTAWSDSGRLYALVSELVRQRLGRVASWGCDPEDLLHDVFLSVARAIRSGEIRDPERLSNYILGTAYRMGCRSLHQAVTARRNPPLDVVMPVIRRPEPGVDSVLCKQQRSQHVQSLIDALPEIEQAIVRKFYLDEVKWEVIAAELELTPNQFRLRKSRALTRMRCLANTMAASSGNSPSTRQ